MPDPWVWDLAECAEYPQALRRRPPRIVHGTLILLVALLATALAWAATTEANLVVRGVGRIRPVTTPVKVFNAARGEILGGGVGARVVQVNARQGDRVRRGDVLVRLETGRLDNEVAKQQRAIRAAEEELVELERLGTLRGLQAQATRAKAQAELTQAREAVRHAQAQREAEVGLAELALAAAEDEEAPLRRLAGRNLTAPAEWHKAAAKTREARQRLLEARLPVDESGVEVAQRVLELTEHDEALQRQELELKRATKRAELEAARLELANFELDRLQATIRAPIAGVVTAGDVKVGDVLEPGKPVAEIAAQEGFLFEATIPSEEVGHLRPGMPTRIKLDAFDYQRYGTLAGTLCFIAPDSAVADGPKAAAYIIRITVPRAELGSGGARGRVKLGMAGQAEIITGRESLLALGLKRIRQSISLG